MEEIGFTGGEPFLNRELPAMLGEALARGYRALVLTNAMKPMQRRKAQLLRCAMRCGAALTMRVSIDHFTPERHEARARPRHLATDAGGPALALRATVSAFMSPAARSGTSRKTRFGAAYAALFAAEAIPVDAHDPGALVLFPEMDTHARRAGDHHPLLEHSRVSIRSR